MGVLLPELLGERMKKKREKKWKFLLNDIASKVYLLLLFQPLCMKEISIILYGNKNQKRMIKKYLDDFTDEETKYITSSDDIAQKQIFSFKRFETHAREKYYQANLRPLFEFWDDSFKEQRERFEILMKGKSFKQLFKTFDPEMWDKLKRKPENVEISENLRRLDRIKPITYEEKKIFEKVWDGNIGTLKENFTNNFLPYIRMPLIDWNVLELLTSFWIDLLKSVVYFRKRDKIKESLNGDRVFLRGRKIDERTKRLLIGYPDTRSTLDSNTLELTRGISDSRVEEIVEFLEITSQYKQDMEFFRGKLYGFIETY